MNANLILSLSVEDAANPYKFKATNINVYSFEEALYHCRRFWKQSIDDFCSDDFIFWVKNSLNLSFISSKIKEISAIQKFSDRLTTFLSLTDYLDENAIASLKTELLNWESRNEWEKLKERADDLMNNGESEKAFSLYKKALQYAGNAALYNNAGIALMKQGDYKQASEYLLKALDSEPDNTQVMLHLAESYILDENFVSAEIILKEAEKYGEHADIYYLRGEMFHLSGESLKSISYYEKAIEIKADPHYIYKLSEVFIKLRLYERAANTMNEIKVKDKYFLKKQAELHVKNNNIPAAIKCIEKALLTNRSNVDLWTRLASYHRQDYDLNKAYSAISTALNIDRDDPRANLEYARVRKAQGRIKDYQVNLNNVLTGLKNKYRENINFE